MRSMQVAMIFVVVLCFTQPSSAGTVTVRNGYVACEDFSSLVAALKYIKEKKDITTSDWQFRRCFRSETLSGLPVEIIDNREGYYHLLLRSEKAGERDLEFWTQNQAVNSLSKPKKTKAKSSQ